MDFWNRYSDGRSETVAATSSSRRSRFITHMYFSENGWAGQFWAFGCLSPRLRRGSYRRWVSLPIQSRQGFFSPRPAPPPSSSCSPSYRSSTCWCQACASAPLVSSPLPSPPSAPSSGAPGLHWCSILQLLVPLPYVGGVGQKELTGCRWRGGKGGRPRRDFRFSLGNCESILFSLLSSSYAGE